jgi:UDPglucose 6-dehydrogenase
VKRLSNERGTDSRIIDAWRANSIYRRDWPLRVLQEVVFPRTPDAKLAVWGIAYKQDTTSTKNSPGVALLEALGTRRAAVYDPAAALPAHLRDRHTSAPDAVSACDDADVLLVMTPWPEFRDTSLDDVARAMRGRILVDSTGVVDRDRADQLGFRCYRPGSPIGAAASDRRHVRLPA